MISSACFKYVLSILLMPKLDSWKMEKQKSIWDHHHNVCKTKQVEALFIYFFSPPPKKKSLFERGWAWAMGYVPGDQTEYQR